MMLVDFAGCLDYWGQPGNWYEVPFSLFYRLIFVTYKLKYLCEFVTYTSFYNLNDVNLVITLIPLHMTYIITCLTRLI